jgi:hypothetical protein
MPRKRSATARRETQRKNTNRPIGTKGIGRYQHSDSRQYPPENMPPFLSGIIALSQPHIPFNCMCVWVARADRWELKFTYALCPVRHTPSSVAVGLPA